MTTYRINDGRGWVEAAVRRWDGANWIGDTPAPTPPPAAPTGFTVKPYTETVDSPIMISPPTLTKSTYSDTSPLGSNRVRHEWDSSNLRRLGLLANAQATTPPSVANKFAVSSKQSPWAVEFIHTGSRFVFRVRLNGVADATKVYHLHVNGEKATAAPVPGATETVLVDFGTSATRTIRIEFDDMLFGGIDVDPSDTVTAGAARPSLGIHGDSWVEGASWVGGVNDPHLLHMAYLTGRILDADCVIGGIGGTGYINGATNTPPRHYNAPDRISPLVSAAPKTLLVFGTINDTNVGIGAAVTEFIQARASDMPNTKLIIVGPQSYNNSTNTAIGGATTDAQMQTACVGQPNVLAYISPRQEQWITGTGNTVTPAGNGNADIYHNGENVNHLSKAGNRYYAEKLATAVAGLVPA